MSGSLLQFIVEVHAFVARARMKNRAKDFTAGLIRQKIRICRACDDWSGSEPFLQCSLCEDFYHMACRDECRQSLATTGLCLSCEHNRIRELRQAYMIELIEDRCFSCRETGRNARPSPAASAAPRPSTRSATARPLPSAPAAN